MIYLDNGATTRPYEAVSARIAEEEQKRFANASALYAPALDAEKNIIAAKKAVAAVLRCKKEEIFLTSGGTFANNLAILGAAEARRRAGNRVVLTKVEHPSVYACGGALEERGFEVVYADPAVAAMEEAINERTVLAAMMLVNNETGLRLPVEETASIIRRKGAPAHFHVDGVQAFCKIPTPVGKLQCDSFSVSAHKIKGPKGIGALYLKKGVRIKNLTFGGEQEGGLVPGTYNSPAAAGFARAVELYGQEDLSRFSVLHDHLLRRLAALSFIQINSPSDAVPYIVNISVMGYLGENVLHDLESRGIYLSQGSACSSRKARSASVLGRMGADEKTVMGALRISFGVENTVEEIDALVDALAEIPQRIQKRYR